MIRVLVVDDSAAVRGIVTTLLADDPEIQVAGVAANGKLAVAKYEQLLPDVVTLDVEMPEMDGLTTLKTLRKQDPQATVLMLSSLTHRGAMTTFDALAAGAVDYVAKPEGTNVNNLIRSLGADLILKIKAAAAAKRRKLGGPSASAASVQPRLTAPQAHNRPPDILAIASSTGGPNALATLLPGLPQDLGLPIVVVQHMPELFTKLLAERLNAVSQIEVREGAQDEIVRPGVAYIAPGGKHMETVRARTEVRLRLHDGPPENSCRPAADVLFRSVAATYGAGSLALVLTGMGQDGLRGCEAIHQVRGQIVAQDEASSVVWGMPRAVSESGMAQAILPLTEITKHILRRVRVHA
jgi:two-component system, chemotaxis family, protein-glutamate methylesterase/glutaminase